MPLEPIRGDGPQAIGVSELTYHIKAILEATFEMVWVAGEASDVVVARSGHVYFTLKDDDSQIRGIIWRGTAARMKTPIKNGQAVVCAGKVEVYAARGQYQLIVSQVQQQGIGRLQQRFEAMRAKLHTEGLFVAERKRKLPSMPRRIAVITSPSGAAVRDFLKAASIRHGGAEMIVVPALMQGDGSAKSVVRAIADCHAMALLPDVIVLTRGGGSLEDLWTFNEEAVVRGVADSTIPTVSAIGHEIDITLCDLAADVRALTPTDAANRVLPDNRLMRQQIASLASRLRRQSSEMLQRRLERLEALNRHPTFRRPLDGLRNRSRLLDEYDRRMTNAIELIVQTEQNRLASLRSSLVALSPLDVLQRGYSVTLDRDGNAIEKAETLQPGDRILTRLHRGTVHSTVKTVDKADS